MSPRILLNLGVFATVAAVMTAWAALTLLPVRFGERPIRIEAEFASSPGLRSGLEVDYLGVSIGRIDTVRLRPGRVSVTLLLDAGTEVPRTVTAQVLRKSAVGEPYVELNSPSPAAEAPPLADGDVIPLARTTSTVEYQRLFDRAGRMLRATDPADLKTVTRELAIGLNGQGHHLRDTLADLDQVTRTIADEAGVLDALSVQLTALAGTLSAKGPQLASGTNDLAAFTAALRDSRKSIDGLLAGAPGFLAQTNALLKESRPGLRCLFTALGTPGAPVFTARNSQEVTHILNRLDRSFPPIIDDVVTDRPEGSYLRLKAVITAAGPIPNARQYPERLTGPDEPPLYRCRDAATTRDTGQDSGRDSREVGSGNPDRRAEEPAGGAVHPAGRTEEVFQTVVPRAAPASPDKSVADFWLPKLPPVVAALVLLGTAAHTIRRVRSLPSHRRRT
ncbi:phospholipid/cholesterol/gamma-HCH transport system substrate-binding protein [Thermomonospora echinospora]|uniref:Phospholipid/cholesterol/gamma-HCH transport system substrate-binding protein n=1 Tax=Thermomonospora echinospora TaxID=1992 RepID=A0A1H6D823_9ACTN|nr:MCE family protein [Thermomonospora echinospora]SEG81432.1 phospholipid/cholesterol/gamma-HCH transport system substrate-binding protein [Thermomonospora echinospora]